MRRAWERLLAFVPTRRAALTLFAVAFVVYWIESLGWPMAKGRDTWDYLAYYLQLFDSAPPLSELQLFRTPLTPLVLGIPLDVGGVVLLDVVFAALYATAIVAWSATALIFGRVPALFSAGLLLVYPAFATIYHQASSDAVFGHRARGLGTARRACVEPAHGVAVRGSGRRHRHARPHPACEPDPAPGRSRAARRARRLEAPPRMVGERASWRLPLPLAGLGAAQRHPVRRRNRGARRSRLGAIPGSCSRAIRRSRPTTGLRRVVSRSSSSSRFLREPPFERLRVPLEDVLAEQVRTTRPFG